MKIGIDGVALTNPFPYGVKHYAQELINALARIDKKNQYVIFSPKKIKIPKSKNFKLAVIPSFPFFKRQMILGRFVKKEKLDVFHYLEPYGSIFFNSPNIITTINDVNLDIIYPKNRSFLYYAKRYYSEITRHFVARYTQHFITISNFTASELKTFLKKNHLKDKRVTTVYDAPSKDYKRLFVQKENYFLCMGDFSPRKNIETVFKAYSLLSRDVRSKYYICVVVSTKKEALRFKESVTILGIADRVKFEIGITNKRLCELYNKAQVFLYPSLYEGFGLPILEAMACGCPVITSKFGAMKEIAGGAALLVDSRNTGEICNSMIRTVQSKTLQNKLIKLGFVQARKFSWEETARQTLSIYKEFSKKIS